MTLRIVCAAAIAVFVGGPSLARADYILQRGDVLELSIAGVPDLKQRCEIGPDGKVILPLSKPISVAGLELSAAAELVRQQLSNRLFQQRSNDGREFATAITPDAVTLSVVEYRPIYLNGDVSKPGSQSFKPGITVRQAIALAGGYELMRFRAGNPYVEGADLRSDYESLWAQYVREQATVWRLQNELSDQPSVKLEEMTNAPLSIEEINVSRNLARQQLQSRRKQFDAESTYVQGAIKLSDAAIAFLRARQEKDEENLRADAEDYQRLKELSSKGNVTQNRVSDARRISLYSATQALNTSVQLTDQQQKGSEVRRQMTTLAEGRKLDVLKQLEDTQVSLAATRAKLQAVSTKIQYVGIIRSQLSGGSKPLIKIYRTGEIAGGVVANEDSELQPGDTIEVALTGVIPSSEVQAGK